jgi:hypothetical protein
MPTKVFLYGFFLIRETGDAQPLVPKPESLWVPHRKQGVLAPSHRALFPWGSPTPIPASSPLTSTPLSVAHLPASRFAGAQPGGDPALGIQSPDVPGQFARALPAQVWGGAQEPAFSQVSPPPQVLPSTLTLKRLQDPGRLLPEA